MSQRTKMLLNYDMMGNPFRMKDKNVLIDRINYS